MAKHCFMDSLAGSQLRQFLYLPISTRASSSPCWIRFPCILEPGTELRVFSKQIHASNRLFWLACSLRKVPAPERVAGDCGVDDVEIDFGVRLQSAGNVDRNQRGFHDTYIKDSLSEARGGGGESGCQGTRLRAAGRFMCLFEFAWS